MAKYMYDSENFPILFENSEVVIFKNPSNEIFIQEKKFGSEMRMNFDDGIQFTSQCRVEPYRTPTSMIGWRIKKSW